MLGTTPVDEVLLLLEALAALAVVALVSALIHVFSFFSSPFEQLDDRAGMAFLSRSDEVVVAYVQLVPGIREATRELVHPLFRSHPGLGGGLQDSLRVLIHPHHEQHVVAPQPPVAGDRVGADLLECVAQVRVTVRVVDSCSDVESGQRESSSVLACLSRFALKFFQPH